MAEADSCQLRLARERSAVGAPVAAPPPQGPELGEALPAKTSPQECIREIQAELEPVQVGVGTAGGGEALVHIARQWLHRNKEDHAFKSFDRSALLHAVCRCSPGIVPWADFCHKQRSNVLPGDTCLASDRGV